MGSISIPAGDLTALAARAFECAGLSARHAQVAASALVLTDLMGISTHGVFRLSRCIELIRLGLINPSPNITIDENGPAIATLDGDNGLGLVVAEAGLSQALRRARGTGLGVAAVRHGSYGGAEGIYGFSAAQAAMIAISGTNASPSMGPFGGRDRKLGNNPLAIGAPRRDAFPLILDMAISVAARGKFRKLRDLGQPLPEGWALDVDGVPTTDPEQGLAGFIQFIGGHKGSGLSLMIDLLAGVLSGGAFLSDTRDMWQQERPMRTSHFFLVIDPSRLMDMTTYFDRVEAFSAEINSCRPFEEGGEVLLPGEVEGRAHARQTAEGVEIPDTVHAELRALASA